MGLEGKLLQSSAWCNVVLSTVRDGGSSLCAGEENI